MKGKTMTRRTAIKLGAVAGTAALGYAAASRFNGLFDESSTAAAHAAAPKNIPVTKIKGFNGKRPNIVLILCDDMGQGDPGCYSNRVIRTPNIDSLARQGVRFTEFYASASLCTPSRVGLLTGRYAVRSGLIFPIQSGGQPFVARFLQGVARMIGKLGAFDMTSSNKVDGLPADEITIADALKTAGYRTMAIGKWHLGDFSHDPQYHPMRHGFDEFFGSPNTYDELPNGLYHNDKLVKSDAELNLAELTSLSTKEAIGFIERNRNKEPFFLYLAYHAPHIPLHASKRFKDKSRGGIYGDVVEELDWGIGEVMKCLAANRLDDDTMVIFTSDNGPWFDGRPGEKGLRGRKGQSYEGGFRDPLIVRWPGRVKPDTVCAEPAMNTDFFPTLLSLAGLAVPTDRVIDGKNITGLITGRDTKTPHDALYFYHYDQVEGIRSGEWKYYRYINHHTWPIPLDKPTTPLGSAAKDRFLGTWPNLYNVKIDEGENYDLASRHPDVCGRMDKIMTRWETAMKKNPGGWVK